MATLESRKRKIKFNAMELKVLIDEANKHVNELQQKHLTLARRNAIWEGICEKVNAVGKRMRSVNDVKRRYQDNRRRTREKLEFDKTSAMKTGWSSVDETPLWKIMKNAQTNCGEQVDGLGGCDQTKQEVQPSTSNPPRAVVNPAEPQKAPELLDLKFLEEQKKQCAALQTIAREMRGLSSLARAARRDTQAVAIHCRQMVSAVSALTMAVNSVAKELREGMQALNGLTTRAESDRLSPTATAKQPDNGEGGAVRVGGKIQRRKRKHK